jgi:ribosomal-protein-alanine N-acetyltransferase
MPIILYLKTMNNIPTTRFNIRLFKPEEEPVYLSLFDDERVMLHLPKRSREELIEVFRYYIEEVKDDIIGRWGIFNKADNDFAGLCLLRPFDDGSNSVELGYVLSHKYWGKGVASEMAAALLAQAYKVKPQAQFVAVTTMDNIPSQKVLEKVGMKRVENYLRMGEELAFFRMDT